MSENVPQRMAAGEMRTGSAAYGLLRRYTYRGKALVPLAQRPQPSWPPAVDPWAVKR